VLSSGIHEFTTVTIPAGVTVRTDGAGVLELRATGPVTILGTIDLSGGNGGFPRCETVPPLGRTQCFGGAGGATGHPGESGGSGMSGRLIPGDGDFRQDSFTGGTGGAGVAGGGGGQSEGYAVPGTGLGGAPSMGGAAGGACRGFPIACTPARAGPCSVATYGGRDAMEVTPMLLGGARTTHPFGGGGGGSIGTAAATDLPVATTFQVGSGGGGAGCPFRMIGAGGGGGGGGALRIASPDRITLGPAARLSADGGNGSAPGGGGGSGGVVVLAAPTLAVASGARVSARAGSASAPGGNGGRGRIRLSTNAATCTLNGTFDPPLASGCAPTPVPVAGSVYVAAFPD
jgi:hypothetical protein